MNVIPMKQTVIIKTQENVGRIKELVAQAIESSVLHEITIRPYKFDRTIAQNSLYWVWIGYMSKETGYSKEEMHDEFRAKFLSKIFERAPERHPAWAETLKNLRIVYGTNKMLAINLHRQCVSGGVSTTKASVKEFTEYLNLIDRHASEGGVRLPLPVDVGLDSKTWKR